mmetsp:Transcript_4769/g.8673  ORF Transcript_4769/g.8673 Transcript_4769/m.8673 type:complete len:499 (+) Transcript_4769:392-1888(+)
MSAKKNPLHAKLHVVWVRRIEWLARVASTACLGSNSSNRVLDIFLEGRSLGDADEGTTTHSVLRYTIFTISAAWYGGLAGERRILAIPYVDNELASDWGGFIHVCTKIGHSVLDSGLSERERHTGLGDRSVDGNVGGIHSLTPLYNRRFVPDSDSVLKKGRVGVEDLVGRTVVPGEVILIKHGDLEVTEGDVALAVVKFVREGVHTSVESGFVTFAINFGHNGGGVLATLIGPGRGPEATHHGVNGVVRRKVNGAVGRTESEVRLVTSILDLESEGCSVEVVIHISSRASNLEGSRLRSVVLIKYNRRNWEVVTVDASVVENSTNNRERNGVEGVLDHNNFVGLQPNTVFHIGRATVSGPHYFTFVSHLRWVRNVCFRNKIGSGVSCGVEALPSNGNNFNPRVAIRSDRCRVAVISRRAIPDHLNVSVGSQRATASVFVGHLRGVAFGEHRNGIVLDCHSEIAVDGVLCKITSRVRNGVSSNTDVVGAVDSAFVGCSK